MINESHAHQTVMEPMHQLIDESGLTVQEIADYLGVSRTSVYRWISGDVPHARTYNKMRRYVYGRSIETIIPMMKHRWDRLPPEARDAIRLLLDLGI